MSDQQKLSDSPSQVQLAKADLARRLGVEPSEIKLLEMREVTWSDGSLGCPRPGMNYTQALVNGSQIRLEVNGETFYYHSGGGRGPFYCADPVMPLEDGGPEPFGNT
jgi:hypothetical protein